MGQAKARGTYEERVQQAKERKKAEGKSFISPRGVANRILKMRSDRQAKINAEIKRRRRLAAMSAKEAEEERARQKAALKAIQQAEKCGTIRIRRTDAPTPGEVTT